VGWVIFWALATLHRAGKITRNVYKVLTREMANVGFGGLAEQWRKIAEIRIT
jgi:hypothetical protein